VQLWSLPDGKELGQAVAMGQRPSVQFSPDGKLLAIGTDGYGVALHDAANGKLLRQLAAPYGVNYKLAFSPDGKTLAAADSGCRFIARWDTADGRRLGVTRSPLPFTVNSVGMAFTNNERLLAWGRLYSAAYVWEVPSGKVLSPLGGHSGDVTAVGFADDGKTILTGGSDARVLRWDAAGTLAGPVAFEKAGGYSSDPSALGFSRDGRRMFSATNGGTVYDLDGAAGREAFCLPGVGADFPGTWALFPSADGTRVVTSSVPYNEKFKTGWVTAWDAVGGKKLGVVEIPAPQGECAAAITPDGTKVVTVLQPRREKDAKDEAPLVVTGWDVATGKKLGEFQTAGGYGRRAVIAANDNATAVVLTPANKVMAIDFVAGKGLKQLSPTRQVDRMAFSPDGKYVAVASHSGFGAQAPNFIVVYDWAKGNPVRKYAGHAGSVTALAFSPDSKLLVSGGSDTTALVWDLAAEGEPLDEK
jgi:WD40 repeat protein